MIVIFRLADLRKILLRGDFAEQTESIRLVSSFLVVPGKIQGVPSNCTCLLRLTRKKICFAQPAAMERVPPVIPRLLDYMLQERQGLCHTA
jgi:hypothetical protein